MISTVVNSQDGKMIVSKTLVETAKAISDMRGAFHANDVVAALQSQGVEITEKQVRAQLCYDGAKYTGRRPGSYHILIKKAAGWYAWKKVEVSK